jgi:hypothetical protein
MHDDVTDSVGVRAAVQFAVTAYPGRGNVKVEGGVGLDFLPVGLQGPQFFEVRDALPHDAAEDLGDGIGRRGAGAV